MALTPKERARNAASPLLTDKLIHPLMDHFCRGLS